MAAPVPGVGLTDDPLRSIARTIVPGAIVALVLLPIARREARRSLVAPVSDRRIVIVRALRRELRVLHRGLPLAVAATVMIENGLQYDGLGAVAIGATTRASNPGRLEAVLVATGIAVVMLRAMAEVADRSLARLDADSR